MGDKGIWLPLCVPGMVLRANSAQSDVYRAILMSDLLRQQGHKKPLKRWSKHLIRALHADLWKNSISSKNVTPSKDKIYFFLYFFFPSGIANVSQWSPSEPHRFQPHCYFTKKKKQVKSRFFSQEKQIKGLKKCK